MRPKHTTLEGRRLSLEDAFFLKRDTELIARMQEIKKREQTRKTLSEVSGITNEKILDKLLDLDVKPETVASLAIVPLVEVAWADGHVDEKEMTAILEGAQAVVIAPGSPAYHLLERWLAHKPGPALFEAWTHYVRGLCEGMTAKERQALKDDLLLRARDVAMASGGFLGLTSRISEKEKKAITRLEAAFEPE